MPDAPFRSPDLEARVAALREERASLAMSLALAEAELRTLSPFSIKRFLLGVSWPFVLVVLMMLAGALLNLAVR